ncbi:hypothetical protein BVE84_07220 [Streptococcus azizii]|uniref:DUF6892 domain-containing protein n=1 Tax=Streptococcus azizii TaxID=1579424 RepID=A0AB36JPX0_9STRE|nr:MULTISPECIES: hypothetical protein [Streptococcus]MBF0776311.1 hypothetical protein [Streptococcus sp. 19428wD3_AN2]ONK26624.1 hypothetical protein BVE86_07040 [Streptococcus azizii]ONK27147.1 hypothetical protein BVE85_06910 [Streptococcus azizii]ONK28029.1 hypothetical protein BVE84_07220 [Streptococcus azizii]TFU83250.1 hypothetical protein E4T83_05930 [Streptococcus sp. AN2]
MGLFDLFKKGNGKQLEFDNFNFKLAIVQELMYEQELLKPKFSASQFCEEQCFDFWEYGEKYAYQVPPEIRDYFETLEIPVKLANKVTKLYFDGGNEIYCEASLVWDGEDDLFDISKVSEAELKQFPNLKTVDGTVPMMTPEVKEFLKSKGVNLLI